MTKKLLKFCAISLFALASCTKEDTTTTEASISIPESQKTALSAVEVKSKVLEQVNQNKQFNWGSTSDYMVWSALQNGNNVCTIGFGNSKTDFDRSKSSNHVYLQNQLLSLISKFEGKPIAKILINADPYLNLIDVIIEKQETVIALRRLGYVRYVEPSDFRMTDDGANENKNVTTDAIASSSGCGLESEAVNALDYTIVTPNAKAPWAFYKHNIPSAWSYSSGKGIGLGVVDSGASTVNSLLNASFNNGLSTGRTVQKYGVYVDSIWPWSTGTDGVNDLCGHGTSMASVATAPRNDKGQPVGVAYNANLVTYRAASNVVLDGYHEQNGVKNAFTALGNNANVKIISMSMGHIISVGKIEDGVRYAYSKGKLIFCAAGTSTSFTTFAGVIFPAWMAETVAVTGIKEASTYQACDVCHTGGKVDFTIMMERASGNHIPVNSYYDAQGDYVGGSSVATATTAGIAALVWAKNPTWTRDQVLAKMRQTSHLYPNKHAEYGYGMPNALLAVQ
ncbi:serine protease [Flavobacterium amnicola]|uniref:Serine protease n=1 Tax=Flavobacterium amnicola TaxID=2506422 RepID=A0A4Q1JZZ7_9FLAO|nr:S8/S53 family peptidase [Flavobacterium amnicola]RXR16258.1 serine protease [Flavobacterium amnicola]